MGKSKRRRIPNQTAPSKTTIPKPRLAEINFRFVTTYPWLKTTSALYGKYKFNNCLHDSEEYAKKITALITKTIPKINADYNDIFFDNHGSSYRHCHSIPEGEERTKVKKISMELLGNDFSEITDNSDYVWWEVGFDGSSRIFGILSRNDCCFFPIFVDWYHLIYPDEKHNQSDYKQYEYSPSLN